MDSQAQRGMHRKKLHSLNGHTYLEPEDGVEDGQQQAGGIDHKHDGVGPVHDFTEEK